jgi:hypothetical protein
MSTPLNRCYVIVEKDIAHELIEGEAIIIHFSTGNYYSLNGIAAELWAWMEAGASYGEITSAFQNLSPEQMADIDSFLEGLMKEGLITAPDEKTLVKRKTDQLPAPGTRTFSVPRFDKYNDMQNLLLSDPIHEVDDQRGWPHASPGG